MQKYFNKINESIENLKLLTRYNTQHENFINNNISIINDNLTRIEDITNEYLNEILSNFTSKKRDINEIKQYCNKFNFNLLGFGDGQLWDLTFDDLKMWEGLKINLDYDLNNDGSIIIVDDMNTLNKRAKNRIYRQNKKQ